MEAYAALVSAIISAIALLVVLYEIRRENYRNNQVSEWSNRSIETLQELYILTSLREYVTCTDTTTKIRTILIQSSVLVEQGRLLFRNEVKDSFGARKQPAYRGYRPKILDPLVIAHEICKDWLGADETRRTKLARLAADNVREFVSLAQKEVGRSRSTSADASRGGQGIILEQLLTRY